MKKSPRARSVKPVELKKFISHPRHFLIFLIATGLGSGLVPAAPGTAGTLVSFALVYAIHDAAWSPELQLAFWLVITVLGTWAAGQFERIQGSQDHSSIVIDEIVGFGLTAATAGTDLVRLLGAFVLFRILDIWKPGPIRWVDRWSHGSASKKLPGWGVMADDLAAGAIGLVILWAVQAKKIL